MTLDELEWDSEDSGNYQDGRDRAEADMRAGRPPSDRAGIKPRAWTEGYRDVCEGIYG